MKLTYYLQINILVILNLINGNLASANTDTFNWKRLEITAGEWECLYNLENNTALAQHPGWGSMTGTFKWTYDEKKKDLRIEYLTIQDDNGYPQALPTCNFLIESNNKVHGSCTNGWDGTGHLY